MVNHSNKVACESPGKDEAAHINTEHGDSVAFQVSYLLDGPQQIPSGGSEAGPKPSDQQTRTHKRKRRKPSGRRGRRTARQVPPRKRPRTRQPEAVWTSRLVALAGGARLSRVILPLCCPCSLYPAGASPGHDFSRAVPTASAGDSRRAVPRPTRGLNAPPGAVPALGLK